MTMKEPIRQVFESLHALMRTGTFTRDDLVFMHRFLAESLKLTRKLMEKADIEEPS